jgi:cell division protein YceG involved in septum cleavage
MKRLWKNYSYAIILIILSFVTAFVLSIRFNAFHQDEYLKVTVSEGDSLWKIADEYSADGSISNGEFVQWVQRHNNIDGDQIFPGEKIFIPVSNEEKPTNELASAAN